MNRLRLLVLFLLILILPAAAGVEERKTFVALSMKVAQMRAREAASSGDDFRRSLPDWYRLGGITRPWAVVIDAARGDWILVGENDPSGALLTLDDLAVALRARFLHGERDPGVTIDPRCGRDGKGQQECGPRQDVRFFGGVERTRFGKVCYEADWLMKRVGLGLERTPVTTLKVYYDLAVEEHRSRSGPNIVSSRFWFYPIVNRVNVLSDVVVLEKFQMGVFTEILYAAEDGKPIQNLDRFAHHPSEEFSRSFSESYEALAREREILENLRGLTRLAALAKGLAQLERRPDVEYYLTAYPIERVVTPDDVELVAVENREAGFKLTGGVTIAALAMRLQDGDASALRDLILGSRRSSDALTWGFQTEMSGGQLAIKVPAVSTGLAELADLYTHGVFLYRHHRYEAALEHFEKLLRMEDRFPEPWTAKGVILNALNRQTEALDCYRRALAIQPRDAVPWYNTGVALAALGRHTEALESYDKAVNLNPTLLHAVHNKARLLNSIGRPMDALAALEALVDKLPEEPENWVEKGYSLTFLGRYEEAIQLFDKAITLSPRLVLAWSNKGNALVELGNRERAETVAAGGEPSQEGLRYYLEALKALSKALDIDPDEPGALWGTGSALASIGRKKEAKWYLERFTQVAPPSMKEHVNRAQRILDHL